jgi:hypothetical protein
MNYTGYDSFLINMRSYLQITIWWQMIRGRRDIPKSLYEHALCHKTDMFVVNYLEHPRMHAAKFYCIAKIIRAAY